MYRYSLADPSWQIRGIVRAATFIACDKLDIVDAPPIRFIRADSTGDLCQSDDCGGWCTNTPEVFLRVDIAPKQIVATAFHELLHAGEFLSGLIYRDLDSSERRARLFALEAEALPNDPAKLLAELEFQQRLIAVSRRVAVRDQEQAAMKTKKFLSSYMKAANGGASHGKLLGGSR
jgi:hypothetical protein